MSYLHYAHVHDRDYERSPYVSDSDSFYSRPLLRRNSKRQRVDIYDSEDPDDYPYVSSSKPSKPSRALTVRQPNQLEKYNIWSPSHSDRRYEEDDRRAHAYKHTQKHYASQPSQSDEEREFRLKIMATFGRPKSSHSHLRKAMAWPGESFKRREMREDVDWRSKEKAQRDDYWFDEPKLKERTVTYRKIKRTRTDEWKPLSGFRRF